MSRPEVLALARAGLWVVLTPIILLTELKEAIWVVLLLSLYANFATDLSVYRAAKADRHAKKEEVDKAEK